MAKRVYIFERKKRVKRKGIHAKSKTSTNNGSALYKKVYNNQGK